MMDTYLMHHGIQGQKWGVENGPPYPLGRDAYDALIGNDKIAEVIRAGDNIYRATGSKESNLRNGAYVSNEKDNKDFYQKHFKDFYYGEDTYTAKYTAVKDVPIASNKVADEIFTKRYNSDAEFKKAADKAIKGVNFVNRLLGDKESLKLTTAEKYHQSLGQANSKKSREAKAKYFDDINKAGYGGIIDRNDRTSGSGGWGLKANNNGVSTSATIITDGSAFIQKSITTIKG